MFLRPRISIRGSVRPSVRNAFAKNALLGLFDRFLAPLDLSRYQSQCKGWVGVHMGEDASYGCTANLLVVRQMNFIKM